MKVLIACEESQTVCKAFRAKGHEAYSCDIQECSGGHPEWHILGDVLPIINGKCSFFTQGGEQINISERWDLIIGHPPCTYLCQSGQKWCNVDVYGAKAKERIAKRKEAVDFFLALWGADCEKICLENPVGYLSQAFRPADQYVKPLMFGHGTSKKTGFWLKNLPKLKATNIVEQEFHVSGTGRKWDKWFWESSCISNPEDRSRFRSKTFIGIANAMADQWG